MIEELNSIVKIKLAPSKIHGIGVFAMRHIPKGTRLYAQAYPRSFRVSPGNLNKLLPDIKKYLLGKWPYMAKGGSFAWPDCFIQGYMNHSDEFNYDLKTDTAIRDIKADEEITENYKDIDGWQSIYTWIK